jgi:poly(A) polymerase Pap1
MEIVKVVEKFKDSVNSKKKKKEIISDIEKEFDNFIKMLAGQNACSGHKLVPYGSFSLDVDLNDSDIDLLAVIPNCIGNNFLKSFEEKLTENSRYEQINIKDEFILQFSVDGINFDLTAVRFDLNEIPENFLELQDSARLAPVALSRNFQTQIQNPAVFKALTRIVKIWLKSRLIYLYQCL